MSTGFTPLEETGAGRTVERAVGQDSGDGDLVATAIDREEEASVGAELERALRGDPGPGSGAADRKR